RRASRRPAPEMPPRSPGSKPRGVNDSTWTESIVSVVEAPRTVELNVDVGELAGEEGRAKDREILSVVQAANVACGAHAGDDETIAATLLACAERGVVAAAHPGYPDREGFGRRRGGLGPDAIRATVVVQVV